VEWRGQLVQQADPEAQLPCFNDILVGSNGACTSALCKAIVGWAAPPASGPQLVFASRAVTRPARRAATWWPGCSSCTSQICAQDPYCCATAWGFDLRRRSCVDLPRQLQPLQPHSHPDGDRGRQLEPHLYRRHSHDRWQRPANLTLDLGLPAGVTGTFNPASVSAGASSTLTLWSRPASASAPLIRSIAPP
jgi:hypothetical protein